MWVLQLGFVEQASCACAVESAAPDRSEPLCDPHVSKARINGPLQCQVPIAHVHVDQLCDLHALR